MSINNKSKQTFLLTEIMNSPDYIKETLYEIIETRQPNYIKGRLVDVYTASLLSTVFNKLNETNQQKFVSKSLDQMVALAYKMIAG
jgi:DNA-binding phage protein